MRMLAAMVVLSLPFGDLAAQSSRRPTLGFGVGVNANVDIRLPLHVARRWRIEPSVGVSDSTWDWAA
jgi:hypothetical protein